MSGTLLHQEEWKKLIPARAGQRFFQSHGEMDPVLGFKQAQETGNSSDSEWNEGLAARVSRRS